MTTHQHQPAPLSSPCEKVTNNGLGSFAAFRAFWSPRTDYTGVGEDGRLPQQAKFTDPRDGKQYTVADGMAGKVPGIRFTATLHLHPFQSLKAGFSGGDFQSYIDDRQNGYLLDQNTGRMFFCPFEVFRVKDSKFPDTFMLPKDVPLEQKQIPMNTVSPEELKKLGL